MAIGHLKNKHAHKVTLDDLTALTALVAQHELYERAEDVPVLCPGGPPVEGIEGPVRGYSCHVSLRCNYSVCDKQTMLRHAKETHGLDLQQAHLSLRDSTVQALFRAVAQIYFEVDIALETCCNIDLRQRLRKEFLTKATLDDVLTQDGDRDRPPLLKITQWDQFSTDIRENTEERRAVYRLKRYHTDDEAGGMFTALQSVIEQHAKSAKHTLENHAQSFTLAKVLLHGPELNSEQ